MCFSVREPQKQSTVELFVSFRFRGVHGIDGVHSKKEETNEEKRNRPGEMQTSIPLVVLLPAQPLSGSLPLLLMFRELF